MRKTTKQKQQEVRLVLPGGCYTSPISVYPENWLTKEAKTDFKWYINYRFYDPKFKDDPKFKHGKQCKVKGMNSFTDLVGRREMTKALIQEEINLLNKGFNPITSTFMVEETNVETEYIIAPTMPWLKAIDASAQRLTFVETTRADLKSMMLMLNKSADQLRLSEIPISDIKRVHLIKVLENCKKSANRQNKYRSYLHSIFEELERVETIEFNPVAKVPIRKVIKDEDSSREILTIDDRIRVDQHLKSNFPDFWRFLHIFFHSGCRESEMLRLQVKDVDFMNQRFRITILKGASYKRVWKAIKTVAMPFWAELLKDAKKDDYVFSIGLVPGQSTIRRDQITRRWRVHVKQKLGVTADFYALKHLNTDETAALAGIEIAAAQNSHTSTRTTLQHYAVGESARKLQAQKNVRNTFVPATTYGETS